MFAFKNDPFFDVLARCPDCVVEYGLFRSVTPYRGEASHRQALTCAMESFRDEDGTPMWTHDAGKAVGTQIDVQTLLSLPDKPWKKTVVQQDGTPVVVYTKHTNGGAIPYWEAFLLPPHGGNLKAADFLAVNGALFPRGTEGLTVFAWSTDWSDYFDDGREWWGTGCWSVYDAQLDRYAVILASATD